MVDLGVLQVLDGASGAALGSAARRALSEAGLALTGAQVQALARTEREALAEVERVSFGPGALSAIIEEFASSPYLLQDRLEPLMRELLGAFYELREEFPASTGDHEIIAELRRAFDGEAAGSVEQAAACALDSLRACSAADDLAAYELVDDEGRVYRWDPDEWHDDITADGWLGERWEGEYE